MSAMRELARTLLAHAPGVQTEAYAVHIARKLRRLGKTMHRLAETACNREMSKREEKLDKLTDERFRALCAHIGCKANISGDPRGHVAHIVFPDGHHNTWGGPEHGFGVNT